MFRELLAHLIMFLTKNRVTTFLTIPREDSYYQTQGTVDIVKNLINQFLLRYSDFIN